MNQRGTPVIYFDALNRSQQWFGVDPKLFIINIGLSGGIALSAQLHPFMLGVALLFFFMNVYLLRKICAVDKQILPVYRTHIHFKKYYAPCAGIHAAPRLIKPSVPTIKGEGGLI